MRRNNCIAILLYAILLLPLVAHAEPMTKEQGDAILGELRQIRQLLQRQPQQQAQPAPQPPKPDEPASVSIAGFPILGKADAPLTMVMFTDYQCPFCSRFENQTLPVSMYCFLISGRVWFSKRLQKGHW